MQSRYKEFLLYVTGILFIFYATNMGTKKLERLKSKKEKEARELYDSYHIESSKSPDLGYYPAYPNIMLGEGHEVKTVKLSNSTTPMACY